jgi:hypothetical protein
VKPDPTTNSSSTAQDLQRIADKAGAGPEWAALMEKCGPSIQAYRPFGGAYSFADVDTATHAREMREEANELTFQLSGIVSNIIDSDELEPSAKAAALTRAASDFATRATTIGDGMMESDDVEDKAWGMEAAEADLSSLLPVESDVDLEALDDDQLTILEDAAKALGFKGLGWKGRAYSRKAVAVAPKKPAAKPAAGTEKAPSTGQHMMVMLRQLVNHITGAPAKKGDPIAELLAQDNRERGSLSVTKDADGKYRWLAIYSNKWYDRDQEVFPEEEHKDFINWLDRTKAFPELWLWHTPGSRVGQADWADYDSRGFVVASGGFDPGMDDVAEKLAADKGLGVSHGFRFRELQKDGTYRGYRSFEISPLPLARAANYGTAFSAAVKEANMLTADKRAFLISKMGEDRTKQIESALDVMSKEFTDKGVGFKEVLDDFVTNGSPAGPAVKSVPPGTGPAVPATPESSAPATDDATKALDDALTRHLAPLTKAVAELQERQKELDPQWVPRSTPAAAEKSVTQGGGASKAVGANDPMSRIAAAANEALEQAQKENGDPPALNVPEAMKWHLGAMFGGGSNAQGGVDAVPPAPAAASA